MAFVMNKILPQKMASSLGMSLSLLRALKYVLGSYAIDID